MSLEITLKNGDKVKINDHVYCSPSWATRDGTPYSVARIMEFLPPEGAAKGRGKAKETYTRVRLAWYYRPGDVSDRVVVDCRLLLAAIFSEVCEISQLRAKCFVLHRDKISDLAGWKKRPDRFYFNRLFDPYIRKEFDVIQTSDVKNLPEDVRDVLQSRYEYVVAEKEIVPDLTDDIRLCDSCTTWCAPQDTVKCDRCKNFFHMACVQPPLLAKPSRGYGWTCAPCSRQHEEEVDNHETKRNATPANGKPKSTTGRSRGPGRPRKNPKQAELEESAVIKHFKMWPFRYFGIHTFPEDTLDPDDFIFPRIATRVGPKFQANVPLVVDPSPIPDTEERGGDSTLEVLSYVDRMSSRDVLEFERCKKALTTRPELKSSVDWLTEAVKVLSSAWNNNEPMSAVKIKSPLRQEKWKKVETRYIDREWSSEEKSTFEEAIMKYGAELRPVREEVGTRSIYEVVRYYAHWKNTKIGEQNVQILRERASGKPTPVEPPSISSDDEGSIVKQPRSNVLCASCKTKESAQWWKAPKGLSSSILCDECGVNWRKYADFTKTVVREGSLPAVKGKAVEKREGTPLNAPSAKRAKTSATPLQATPPPSSVPQLRCSACHRHGPVGKVLKCQVCEFQTHAGTCGAILEPTDPDEEGWTCELCQNDKSQEASLNPECVLCPRPTRDREKEERYPPSDSFLRAEKPTEGQGWAHILCSVFIPEITFSDVNRLRLVEGISVINPHRWSTRCCLCSSTDGAVVRCCDCSKEFHASCAWTAGHRFGFDIQAVKHSRRDQTTIIHWNSDTGNMVPVISCKEHTSRRTIHEMCEMNDLGETALQTYCRNYKKPPLSHTHALLRKARRLDQVLGTFADVLATTRSAEQPPPAQCARCKTAYSPFFYPGQGVGELVCHRCQFEIKETGVMTNGTVA